MSIQIGLCNPKQTPAYLPWLESSHFVGDRKGSGTNTNAKKARRSLAGLFRRDFRGGL